LVGLVVGWLVGWLGLAWLVGWLVDPQNDFFLATQKFFFSKTFVMD